MNDGVTLETQVAVMSSQFTDMRNDLGDIKTLLKDHVVKHEGELDKQREIVAALEKNMSNKYAAKWVERAVSRIAWAVVIAVVGAVLALVFMKPHL